MTSFNGLSEDESWYKSVQGNILRPHGRDNVSLIVLSFQKFRDLQKTKEWLASLPITSFKQQVEDAQKYRSGKTSKPFMSCFLSASGYRALGYSNGEIPSGDDFRSGMKVRGKSLNDSAIETWDKSFSGDVDAVVLVADDDPAILNDLVAETVADARLSISKKCVLGIETGDMNRDEAGFTRNHFGFRDGISNPVFLAKDIKAKGSTSNFDSRANKELVLVKDSLFPHAFGSFVVIRKLEQNVKKFREAEINLAEELGFGEEHADLMGAIAVGRFRDGRPVIPSEQGEVSNPTNDFNFIQDPNGSKCPFHSHIRKVNDRGESLRKGAGHGDERTRRIARRGMAYGSRDNIGEKGTLEMLPTEGVGIHFLCYQSSIEHQFEHLQRQFANNKDYFNDDSGIDGIIGQTNDTSHKQTWQSKSGESIKFRFGDFVNLKGGEYLYAPPVEFFRSLGKQRKKTVGIATHRTGRCSTERTKHIREAIVEHCYTNRASEWFNSDMLPDLIRENPSLASEPVIVRKAMACNEMLRVMTDKAINEKTRTFEIRPGELIAGTIPLGSVGLGKTFPRYLTDTERRASSLSNRDEPSVFGHTTPNFSNVLNEGLEGTIRFCEERLSHNMVDLDTRQRDFFRAVIISSKAVIDYSKRFAELAEELASSEKDKLRKEELRRIASSCRHVPARGARDFHEALQSVWFLHLAQSSFCVFNSLGRLDQVLGRFYEDDLETGTLSESEGIEFLECFLMKFAERLHLNPTTLRDQDHLSFGTGIGTRPIYLDQVASCNNFIQNIVLGGVNREGEDATNSLTYAFLRAAGNVGLCTPTINVRVHKGAPDALLDAVDETLRNGGTGHPILFNDDVIVKGMSSSGIPLEESRDYTIAGCWEPVLNGNGSFIFGMVNFLRALECALNEGMLFNPDHQFLKGQKQSLSCKPPSEYADFSELMSQVERQLQFFADKVALGTCTFFKLAGSMTPTPFMSSLLDGCLERGLDQSWGGADYNLVSDIAFGIPNTANALANIKKFVFEEKRWSLQDVAFALRINWGLQSVRGEYEPVEERDDSRRQMAYEIRRAFLDEKSKYGNDLSCVDSIMAELMHYWKEVTNSAAELACAAFTPQRDCREARQLRAMANYSGGPLSDLHSDFSLFFTAGSGTFGQYSSMGKGVSASADGRAAHAPVVPNCSPESGTAISGISAFFNSLSKLGLEDFGSAVVTDIRIDGVHQPDGYFSNLVSDWVSHNGSMLTISVLSTDECQRMLRISDKVRAGILGEEALRPFADRFCRVGGWNSGYICLPRPQQRDHLIRSEW